MSRRYRRPALALALVALVATAMAVFMGASTHRTASSVNKAKLFGDPDRIALRTNARSHTLAGEPTSKNREGKRSPVSLEEQTLIDRAYPAKTIMSAWQKGSRDYSRNIFGRGNDDGNHGWQLAGPSTSTVPTLLNRTNSNATVSGRVTAMAIDSSCTASHCTVWIGAAGGGVWRTSNGLASSPSWRYLSGDFATNAIGALTYDAASHTLYAGTGEQNSSADSEAGVGIYRSTDGGDHWSLMSGSVPMSAGNSISSIVVDHAHPGTLYVGTTYGIRGIAGIGGSAQPSYVDPSAPKPGLWKSTDDGSSFSLVYDDSRTTGPNAFSWGVNHVELDSHGTIYMAAVAEGISRSTDGGTTWEQVFATQDSAGRSEFALNTVNPGAHTRIYVGDGGNETGALTPDGASYESTSGVYRADNIDTTPAAALTDGTTNPGYTSFSTYDRTQPGYLTYDYCWGQCWYDNFVYSPAGSPDVVYVLGAYNYDFPTRNNGRAVLLSNDAGTHWYDQTADLPAADGTQNGIHPDQHAIVVNPANPLQFFEGSDGGVARSSGALVDGSGDCNRPGASAKSKTACRNALAQIPTHLDMVNNGLSTLQFQGVVDNPTNAKDIFGGTQDNGSWEGLSGVPSWTQTMWGDGGIAAFDISNSDFRMNEFYGPYTDVNMHASDPTGWVTVAGPLAYSGEPTAFYKPQINDPAVSGTMFQGGVHVWRTQDFGGVTSSGLSSHCTEFQPGLPADCGDFAPLGDANPSGGLGDPGDLTASGVYGTDKSGGYVVAIARTASDKTTLWAATRRGRVFISKNANAAAPLVSFSRIDSGTQLTSSTTPTPRRFVAGIAVDPKNPNHAYVAFGGYNAATNGVSPPVPGHVFDVLYNPLTGKATWTSLDRGTGPLGDMPINSIALDEQTNHLYVGTDFGVLTQLGKSGFWRPAAGGMPMVAVAGLTLDSKNRVLYAATHGRGAWVLQLNGEKNKGGGGGEH